MALMLVTRKNLIFLAYPFAHFSAPLGGGTLREMILNNLPFYFKDYNYIWAVFSGILFCRFVYRHFNRINKIMLVLDAIGLTAFAFIGASRAASFHLGWAGIVFCALLTATGGGILKDMVANDIPTSFRGTVYASPAIILGFMYYFFKNYMTNSIAISSLLAFVFLIRFTAIQFDVKVRSLKEAKETIKEITLYFLKKARKF